jgi:tetratricopeptide (TPR) repeat protein
MVAGKTCRLSGINKDLMYPYEQPSSNRDLFICGQIARRKRNFQFAAYFFCLLLSLGKASGQTDYETRLAEAVSAQSAGNISGAIASYQRALAVRRDVPEVWANLGLMQHQAGDYAGALSSFKAAYQLQPKLFVPLLFLGIENLQLNNRTDAVHYLSMARQLHPNDSEIYINLGRADFGLKQFENASVAYRRATQLNPNNGEAWYRLGITYLEMSEVASGDLAALNRQSPFFQRLEAESLSDQDKLAESAEAFRKLLSGQNSPPCSRSSFGLVLLRRRELSEAQSEFEQELKSGGCSLTKIGLVRVGLEKGETESALKSLASLWALDSGFLRAHIFELARGMTPGQIKAFDSALASADVAGLSPEAISVLRLSLRGSRTLSVQSAQSDNEALRKPAVLRSAQEYFIQGEYRRCTKSLFPAMSSPSSQKLSLLATCSFFTGDYETTLLAAKKLWSLPLAKEEGLYWSILADQRLAVLALAYAGEVEPGSVRLHELLAESYRDREKYAEAEEEYKVALGINPHEFAALVGAATNYLQELRIDLAHKMIQNALAQNPSDAEANYIMGEVLFAEHKYSDAEPYLIAGLTTRAELIPRIHALLGQIYASQGDTKRAIEEYKLGLPSDDDGSVHYQLARLYQRTGEAKLAAEAFADSKSLNQRKQAAARATFGLQQKTQPPQN